MGSDVVGKQDKPRRVTDNKDKTTQDKAKRLGVSTREVRSS